MSVNYLKCMKFLESKFGLFMISDQKFTEILKLIFWLIYVSFRTGNYYMYLSALKSYPPFRTCSPLCFLNSKSNIGNNRVCINKTV